MKKQELLANGVLVDPVDEHLLDEYMWNISPKHGITTSKRQPVYRSFTLSRLIMNAPANLQVDHINHNILDNRRCNLRLATNKENCQNRRVQKNNKIGLKGVRFRLHVKSFEAYIVVNGKQEHLGYFDDSAEAALAYNKRAKQAFGPFAKLNEI